MIGYLDCSTGVSGDKFLGALLDAGAASGDFTAERPAARSSAALAPEARVTVERVTLARHRGRRRARRGRRAAALTARGATSARCCEAPTLPDAGARPRAARVRGARARPRRTCTASTSTTCTSTRSARSTRSSTSSACAPGCTRSASTSLVASPVAIGSRHRRDLARHAARARARDRGAAARRADRPDRPAGRLAAGELTTPTGAALLRALRRRLRRRCRAMLPRLIGYGAGTRDIGSPNVCRLILGDARRRATPALTAERGRRCSRPTSTTSPAEAARVRRRAAARRGRARRVADAHRHEEGPLGGDAVGARRAASAPRHGSPRVMRADRHARRAARRSQPRYVARARRARDRDARGVPCG